MPSSLRFILIVIGLSVVSAVASAYLIFHQDEQQARTTAEQLTGGHVDSGRVAIGRYGCGGCHQIRGINDAEGKVGPSLNGIAARAEIAGRLSNQPANMVMWLRHPQQVVPGNGMPDQGINERDARDIAAYLYTLRK